MLKNLICKIKSLYDPVILEVIENVTADHMNDHGMVVNTIPRGFALV